MSLNQKWTKIYLNLALKLNVRHLKSPVPFNCDTLDNLSSPFSMFTLSRQVLRCPDSQER